MKRTDNSTLTQIRKAVEAAFPGPNGLVDLDVALNDNLADERWTNGTIYNDMPLQMSFSAQVKLLLQRANGRGWLPDMLAALSASQPGNSDFGTLLAQVNAIASVSAPDAVLQDILPGTALGHFNTLERRMRVVCRVDYADRSPPGAGTGFLVGTDLVMTNHHVARRVIENSAAAAQLRFRFDLRTPEAAADGAGRCCGAKFDREKAVLSSSPPGGVEINAIGEPTLSELDYALIRLAEQPGDDAMGDCSNRGFLPVAPDMPIPLGGTSIIALQHPMRGELQFAVGTISGANESGSRIHHNAATLEGSSGCLVLDVALGAALLHNGTRPGSAAEQRPYNTGVPLQLIARDLAAKGFL